MTLQHGNNLTLLVTTGKANKVTVSQDSASYMPNNKIYILAIKNVHIEISSIYFAGEHQQLRSKFLNSIHSWHKMFWSQILITFYFHKIIRCSKSHRTVYSDIILGSEESWPRSRVVRKRNIISRLPPNNHTTTLRYFNSSSNNIDGNMLLLCYIVKSLDVPPHPHPFTFAHSHSLTVHRNTRFKRMHPCSGSMFLRVIAIMFKNYEFQSFLFGNWYQTRKSYFLKY
jgi:hypothetical protein